MTSCSTRTACSAEFLAARDGLLPDDEALLAAQWALVDRGVFEVLETTGTELELRDVATGDRIRVVNTHPSDDIRAGTLLVGRPLPVGETYRAFSGFMPLPHGHQDAMLAAIDSRRQRGDRRRARRDRRLHRGSPTPTARTSSPTPSRGGCRSPTPSARRWSVPACRPRATITGRWCATRRTRTTPSSPALRLDGDELTVEVNSAERAAELEILVADALPDAEVIDVDVHPFEMPDEPVRTSGMQSPNLDDPAIRAVLAEHVAGYERRWLDESIPALGGRTPREAAGDPIGREELTRLLASFPVPGPDDIGAMDPDRLRAALGL